MLIYANRLGVDFIGTISSLGPSCTSRFKKGDRVMTFSQTLRAFAEYIVVPESILAKVPQGLSDEQAATLPIPALTAWQGVHAIGAPKKGMKVLIHGASGVCGAFAVQFAKLAGMYVIGTASGKNKPYVLSLGADEFIDYNTQTFEDLISSIDLILDFVLVGGSMSTTDRSWKVLKKGGMLVSFADPGVSVPEGYRGVFLQTKVDVEVLEDVGEMVVQGKVKSKVARVFGRGEVGEAMEVSRAGGGMGRLLVDFGRV